MSTFDPDSCPNSSFLENVLAVPIHQHINISLSKLTYPTPSSPSTIPTAIVTFPLTPHVMTPARTLHGGITTLCLDTVCLLAVAPTLKAGENVVTISSSFQLLDSVTWNEGDELTLVELEGRVLRRGGRIAFCESVAKCKGKVLGRGMLTKMIIQAPKESKV
jgi:acyl-coenzyme A thioesterase PaaI-like protein